MTYVTGEMEKIQNDFNCFFLLKRKKEQWQTFISIRMLLFLETITAFCAYVPAATVSFCI